MCVGRGGLRAVAAFLQPDDTEVTLLTLTRKVGQTITVLDPETGEPLFELTVKEIRRNQVRVGVEAPREYPIYRTEVLGSEGGKP